MDLLFGTYTCPGHEPRWFGIKEPMWRSYLGQMIYPFLAAEEVGGWGSCARRRKGDYGVPGYAIWLSSLIY